MPHPPLSFLWLCKENAQFVILLGRQGPAVVKVKHALSDIANLISFMLLPLTFLLLMEGEDAGGFGEAAALAKF